MKKSLELMLFAWLLGLVSCLNPANADTPRATAAQAVAFVQQGAAYLKQHGKEKAFAAFNDLNGPFVKGELYFFVYGTNGDGVVLAHGQNPKMLGRHLINLQDPDGVFIIREATKIANSPSGKGWLKYRWPNSVTQQVEKKISYIERVGDVWIGCGIYPPE
ncbi:MAG: hypothetical protein RL748_4434 [Pseudomonadota bacterium]|jgi:signal transduction histidine kinase